MFVTDNFITPPFPSHTSILIDTIDLSPPIVERHLHKLSPKFSLGPEKIPSFFLQKCSTSLALPLSLIFSASFTSGRLPQQWRTGSITPIHKKNSKRDRPGSYRPISILSNICKCFERIVKQALYSHLQSNGLLADAQFGFRDGRSTSTQLISFVSHILSRPPNTVTDVCYVDFSRAFDSVPHRKLLHKLSSYGIGGPLHRWISSWLENRTQFVCVDETPSITFPVEFGVPQGSCLGPLLFIIYINDIVDSIGSDSTCFLFADDLKIVSTRHKSSTSFPLQSAIDNLDSWCTNWQMTINPTKTVVLHSGRSNPCHSYTYLESALVSCKTVRDLGVLLTHDLSFRDHIVQITSKATKCINFLFIALKTRHPAVLIHAFKSYCLPILDYCSVVYEPHQVYLLTLLERVQYYFLRRLCHRCHVDFVSYSQACQFFQLDPLTLRRATLSLSHVHSLFSPRSTVSPSSIFSSRTSNTRGLPYKFSPLYKSSSNPARVFYPHRLANVINKLNPSFFDCKRSCVSSFVSSSECPYFL